jgi:hypothetical protein
MMLVLEDMSQHMADIAENGVNAGATRIRVSFNERTPEGWLLLEVEDNGKGMDQEMLRKVVDPFVTSRTTRRVGLGIPFLKQMAELCGGELILSSVVGEGTLLRATLRADAVDCPPLGDIPLTVMTLFAGYPRIQWIFSLARGEQEFALSSEELLAELEDPELFALPEVALWIRETVEEGLREIRREA